MREVDPGVDDADENVLAAGLDRPGLLRVDVGIRRAGDAGDVLSEVVEAPERVRGRVVGCAPVIVGGEPEVRLGEEDSWIALQGTDRGRRVL
jgi:hypothetical protein